MPKYTNRFPYDEWRDKLYSLQQRIEDKPFSIVYRFYSIFNGPVRYVGRSDDPFGRESKHYNKIWDYSRHSGLEARVAFVEFCYFTGRSRLKAAYEEESLQYHLRDPDCNENHPKRKYSSWRCPDKECCYH